MDYIDEYETVFLGQAWPVLIMRGIAGLIFGAVALSLPAATAITVLVAFAIYMVVHGVIDLVHAGDDRPVGGSRGAHWARGLLALLAGAVALFRPQYAEVALTICLGAWPIVFGLVELRIAHALRRHASGAWVLVFMGLLSIATGLVIALRAPLNAHGMAWAIGVYSLLYGTLEIVTGLSVRSIARAVSRADHPHPDADPTAAARPG
jgi:uncharacterized membrane protein HdeD (DUF308 family)